MRSLRTLLLGALLVALAACGGEADTSSAAESTGGEPSTLASASESAAETPDGGGPGATDVDGLLAELEPPNSTELSRTTVPAGTAVAYESTDTVGDLRTFYIQKIAELNLEVIGTTELANSYAVVIASDGLGGTIGVQNVGDVTNVLVTIGESS